MRRLLVALVLLALTACGPSRFGGAGQALTTPEQKYRLIDTIGPPLFCGPPVVRIPSDAEAASEVASLRSQDAATFDAIVHHEKLDSTHLTPDDERRILEQSQRLAALPLRAEGPLSRFDYVAGRPSPEHVVGTIDDHGAVSLESHAATQFPGRGGCPICLAASTRIATPRGEIPVTLLRPGMLVWTIDDGRRVAAPIAVVGHTPAPPGHRVIRVLLADGRAVTASPGHPTADGRRVGELNLGDPLDGSRIVGLEVMAYAGNTWDLLPLSSSGAYWADGVLLGSTLTHATAASAR